MPILTNREIVLAQIAHEEMRPVPYKLGFEREVGILLDEYYGNNQWREYANPYIFNAEAIGFISLEEDLGDGYVRDTFGGVWFTGGNIEHLERPALPDADLAGFTLKPAEQIITLEKKQEISQALRGNNNEKFSLLSIGQGIWENYWHIRGFENALADCVAEQDFFEELLRMLTDLTLEYVELVSDLPCDALLLSDDWGEQNGVLLGKERWIRFIKPEMARIAERVHKTGKRLVVHSCGSVGDILGDIVEAGVDVLESVQPEARGNNPYELKKHYGDKITFWGGLGSQSIIPYGTPAALKQEIESLISYMGKGGGYIAAPAKWLMYGSTPVENAAAILEAFTNQRIS